MIRFEILLPLFHNDGRRIEEEQFVVTDTELTAEFGAISIDSVTVRGRWTYKGVIYSDELMRIRIDLDDVPENWDAMRRMKTVLKDRFEQEDIWITAHRIEVI
ncbi:MAG: hypothetical protein U0793_34605 [Gemmataceae bacterium]